MFCRHCQPCRLLVDLALKYSANSVSAHLERIPERPVPGAMPWENSTKRWAGEHARFFTNHERIRSSTSDEKFIDLINTEVRQGTWNRLPSTGDITLKPTYTNPPLVLKRLRHSPSSSCLELLLYCSGAEKVNLSFMAIACKLVCYNIHTTVIPSNERRKTRFTRVHLKNNTNPQKLHSRLNR